MAPRDGKLDRLAAFGTPLPALLVVLICIVFGWIGHFQPIVDVIGEGAASFLRRQSEAYAMIALVVFFWAFFARDGHPAADAALEDRKPKTSNVAWFGWFVALLIFSIIMVTWDAAPGFFVTQKEALVGVALVTWYLAWSRGLRPGDEQWRRGLPIRNRVQRYRYYVVVLGLIAIAYTNAPADLMGDGFAVWLTESNEGFVGAILIPLYFDFFSRSRSKAASLAWYAFLILAPVAIQMNVFPEALSAQVEWFEEVTEAFIAALGVSLFFDILRVTGEIPVARSAQGGEKEQPATTATTSGRKHGIVE